MKVIRDLNRGDKSKDVATKYGVNRKTIYYIARQFEATGSVKRKPGSGRNPKLTERTQRALCRHVLKNNNSTLGDLKINMENSINLKVSIPTIKNTLSNAGIHSRVARSKPLLTQKHKAQRLAFANLYKDWNEENWENVIFSDETAIKLKSVAYKRIYRKNGTELAPNNVQTTLPYGGGNTQIWGCMCAHGVGFMCKLDKGLDSDLYREILKNELDNSIQWYYDDKKTVLFQQDNLAAHKTQACMKTLAKLKIAVMDWPPKSPDLNPIENLWNLLKRKVRETGKIITSKNSHWDLIEECWNAITPEECKKLIHSIPRRIKACIEARGGHTKY